MADGDVDSVGVHGRSGANGKHRPFAAVRASVWVAGRHCRSAAGGSDDSGGALRRDSQPGHCHADRMDWSADASGADLSHRYGLHFLPSRAASEHQRSRIAPGLAACRCTWRGRVQPGPRRGSRAGGGDRSMDRHW